MILKNDNIHINNKYKNIDNLFFKIKKKLLLIKKLSNKQ